MRALVVVESVFGNTRAVADAIAEGMAPVLATDVVEVAEAPRALDPAVDLVVVGGPTHALGMSRPRTRQDAYRQAGRGVPPGGGVREWLATAAVGRVRAAAFDTRVDKRWAGSAVRGIAKGLRRQGATMVAPPASFVVTGIPGPLAGGELDRARRWGADLAATMAVSGRTG